jgi:hypothetical protein
VPRRVRLGSLGAGRRCSSPAARGRTEGSLCCLVRTEAYLGSVDASGHAPKGCSCLNVERADIVGRACAVRSVFYFVLA